MTNDVSLAVRDIQSIGHEEAMRLAETEWARMFDLVDALSVDDWTQPTDCTGWDVRAVLAHLLGMLELQADEEERWRQFSTRPSAPSSAAEQGWTR